MEIDTGNPDLKLSWGNTVRYNLGVRTNGRNDVIGNSPNTDEGDYLFDRGDVVTNRIDLLTEIDASYKRNYGLRLSASAWNDWAYKNESKTNPGLATRGSYTGNEFSSYTKRYFKGPSGEFLDAYVYSAFSLGDMGASFKLGRQTVLWGEAISLSAHSVSYAQAPSDGLKGLATPGADAKELALPVGQLSGSLQVTQTLTLAAQYYFEWQPTRVAEGGTYLGGTDFILQGPDRFSLSPAITLTNRGVDRPKNSGNWGFSARWTPSWLDGTLGAYVREFDERSPTISLNIADRSYRAVYPENARLYGVSLATSIAGVSTGFEIVHREKTALNSSITDGAAAGARGKTWHALANAVAVAGPNKLWDQLTVTGELAYSYLEKVTSGEQYFLGCYKRAAGDQDANTGCVTRDAWQGFLRISPSWVAVWPGWDISGLASISAGLHGNSAVLGGGNYRAGSYSLGATFTYNQRHDFSIAFNDYLATNQATAAGTIRVSNGSQIQDRGWVVFTYKGSF